MPVRNSAKALVLNDGKILVNRCVSRFGDYYALPGGGQREGETLLEAVRRELLEETGYSVAPVRLSGIYERVCENRESGMSHKLYFVFLCRLEEKQNRTPTERDRRVAPPQSLSAGHPRQSPGADRLRRDDLSWLRTRILTLQG